MLIIFAGVHMVKNIVQQHRNFAFSAVTALDGGELEEFIDSGSGVVDADSAQERLDELAEYLK